MTRTWQQLQQFCALFPLCTGFCNPSTRVNLTNGLPHNVFASLARQLFQYAPVLCFKVRGSQGPCRLLGRGLVAAYLPPSAIWDCRHVFDFFRNVPSWRNQAHWSEILLCHILSIYLIWFIHVDFILLTQWRHWDVHAGHKEKGSHCSVVLQKRGGLALLALISFSSGMKTGDRNVVTAVCA